MQTNNGIPYVTKTGVNGGVNYLAQRVTKQLWANPDPVPRTTPCLVTAGMVIPARTWLQRNSDGTVQPHTGFVYSRLVTITTAPTAGDTVTIANATATWSVAISFTKKQTIEEAVDIIINDTGLNTTLFAQNMSVAKVSPTSFIISLNNSDNTALQQTTAVASGTLAVSVAATVNGTIGQADDASLRNVAGLMVYDTIAINHTTGLGEVTHAQMYVSGSLYEEGVRWANSANETLTDAWGNVRAVTAYNTGCTNIYARNAFLQNTDFEIRITREAM